MWRKFLYPLVLGVLIFFLIREWEAFKQFLVILKSGSPLLILAALAFQILYFIFFSAIYQMGMVTVGIGYRLRDIIPVMLSWQAVNVAAISAGFMGAAILIDDARRRGASVMRGTAGYLLALLADYFGIMLALVIGFGYAFWNHGINTYQIIATGILLTLILLLNIIFLLAAFSPRTLAFLLHTLAWGAEHLRKIFHKSSRSLHDWVEDITVEFQKATIIIRQQHVALRELFFFSILSHVVNLACLQLLFAAFDEPVRLEALIAGYGVGKLFLVISITPQGIGVVEGVMTLVFANLGVPTATAAAVVIAFRGMNLWLPVLIGVFTLRRTKSLEAEPSQSA